MPLPANTQLGPYKIIDLLGVGGMGEVYRARDMRLERDVALKVLSQQKIKSPDHKQRFILEAKAASGLNHPNIITIYDIGSAGETDYIAMEYIAGKTLDAAIPSNGMRLPLVLKVAIDVAEGLSAAHRAGIVHRDLKPANIMLTDDGRVKLLDFGLAKLVESTGLTEVGDPEGATSSAPLTIEGAILGTVSYMSPEQAEGFRVDPRSDVFSFGAVLYEMITGKRAFTSSSTISTLSAILKEEPQRASSLVAGVPDELERVIARCLRKDPDRRWQSMRDVVIRLTELKEISDSGTLIRSTAGATTAPASKSSRRPLWGGIVAGVIIATTLGAWWITRQQPVIGSPASNIETAATTSAAAPIVAKPAPEVLTNASVIEMVGAGLSNDVIVEHVKRTKSRFDLSTAEVIRLSKAGVPDIVITAMRGRTRAVASDAAPSNQAAPSPAPGATIAEGTALLLTLEQEVSTATAKEGQRVSLSVAKNVLAGSVVVIPAGTKATATISSAGRKTMFRRAPKLRLTLNSLQLPDGQPVRLRSSKTAASDKTRGGEIDAASLIEKPADAAKIQDIVLPKGTQITGFLDAAVKLGPPQPK